MECQEYYGDKFDYVTEVTRPLARKGFEINEGGNNETQRAIIDAHIENISLDNVIMDRCIIDGAAYSYYFYEKDQISSSTWSHCIREGMRKCLRKMDIIFMTESVEMKDDGVRSTNIDFRERIEDIFNVYRKAFENDDRQWGEGIRFNGEFIYLTGDVDKRFNEVKIAIDEYECRT